MKAHSVSRRGSALIVIILAALSLRTIFLLLARDLAPLYDETTYLNMAKDVLASGNVRPRWLWPPGQPYFMAGVFSIFGVDIVAVKAVQVVLSTLSVYLTYLVTRQVFRNERTALLACAITAIYPSFIAFSHYLWSETLFIFLFLCSIHMLLRFVDVRKYGLLAASGGFFALGCLTRPVLLPAIAVVLVYLWSRLRSQRRVLLLSAVVFTVAAGAVMTPWLIRTVLVYDGWMGIAPSAHHLWRGNSGLFKGAEDVDNYSRQKYDKCGTSVLERDRYAFQKGIESIRAEQPYWILKKGLLYLRTWRFDRSFLLRHMKLGLYGEIPPAAERFFVTYIRCVYLAVMLAAIVGLCWTTYRPEKWFLIGLLLTFSAVCILTISRNTRLRLPLEVILIMFSAEGYLLPARLVLWYRDRNRPDRPGWVRRITPPSTGKALLRAALYCLFTAIFIYNCSVNVIRVARKIFP